MDHTTTSTETGTWAPMAAAAERMGIGYRTLQRRIKDGVFRTRTAENGTKEVLVPDGAADGGYEAATDGHADDDSRRPPGTALVLAGSHRQMAERLVKTAEMTAKRSRRTAGVAWSLTALLTVGLLAGTWWTTKQITGLRRDLTHESRRTASEATRRQAIEGDLDALRERAASQAAELAALRHAEALRWASAGPLNDGKLAVD